MGDKADVGRNPQTSLLNGDIFRVIQVSFGIIDWPCTEVTWQCVNRKAFISAAFESASLR